MKVLSTKPTYITISDSGVTLCTVIEPHGVVDDIKLAFEGKGNTYRLPRMDVSALKIVADMLAKVVEVHDKEYGGDPPTD